MRRRFLLILPLAGALLGATLQKLSLNEMIDKSTSIVRAKVGSCAGELQGSVIYTTCQLLPVEQWKGTRSAGLQVSVPGGTAGRVRQSFSGSPALAAGEERIFFLWTGKSGRTQVMGLSQGLMRLQPIADGTVMAVRAPVRETLLDSNGQPVWDEGFEMPLDKLRQTVQARVGK